jgi:hypothetical protein
VSDLELIITSDIKGNVMATKSDNSTDAKPICGIIMPISAIDDCSAEHWAEVLSILQDVIRGADFEPNLVSDADDIGIIQKRIVQNVYSNELVVCDVSGKNPNVMFELGMRLAFDKPTIIVKDDLTNYSFDTSVIEHLEYPRDLRFTRIVAFKEKLKNKLIGTYQKSKSDPAYSTFLKSFGEYKVAHLQSKEISSEAYILESLDELKRELRLFRRANIKPDFSVRDLRYQEECINVHISEYAHEHGISKMSELKRHKAKIVDYLKAIDHVRQVCSGDELPLRVDVALQDKLLLRNSPLFGNGRKPSSKNTEADES